MIANRARRPGTGIRAASGGQARFFAAALSGSRIRRANRSCRLCFCAMLGAAHHEERAALAATRVAGSAFRGGLPRGGIGVVGNAGHYPETNARSAALSLRYSSARKSTT